jgi:hypothetical protein
LGEVVRLAGVGAKLIFRNKNIIPMKKITFLLIVGLLLGSFSCTNQFEEINTNPNVPLTVPPNLLLPGIIRDACNDVEGVTWGIGNIVVQYNSKIQFVNEDRYLWGEQNTIWNGMYTRLRDVNNLITIAQGNNQRRYEAIGLIIRSWMFSLLTDCYGDVPYSEAIKAKSDGINLPRYDAQEQIYTGILADLARANEIITQSNEAVTGDILFSGNVDRWRRLANSLRVRYLMRISDRRNVAADLQAILGNPAQNPLMASNADNAALTYLAAAPNQFPRHLSRVGSFDEFRSSQTMVNTLLQFNDPRLTVYSRPTNATIGSANPVYVGVPNGLDDVAALQFNGGSNFMSRIGTLFFEEAITPRGQQVARGVIMNYAELQFNLAEARQKNLISSGETRAYYEAGINASFGFAGVPVPANYLAQPGVAWDGANALTLIGTQKWLSLYYQGMEAWFDWRRTGIPRLVPGRSNLNQDRIPVRFIYPTSEQGLNAESRNAAVTRQGPDDINTRVWWDVR